MNALAKRFDKAEEIIKKPSFRENKGLGNEVGYYIFDYLPEEELYVRERVEYIQKKNESAADDYKIAVFDLYEIIISILNEKGYLERCYDIEKKKGFQKVSVAVANLMRITSTDGLIVEYIKDRVPEKAIVFLVGIGKCFPIIRSHTVLNNLHQVIDNVPVVMFYPGKYDGQELILFNEIKDDNFSYIDNETLEEKYVTVPEQGGGKLIPEGICKPGQVYAVGKCKTGMIGTYRLEAQVTNGGGKFSCTGIGTMREAKESVDTAFRYLKANSKQINGTITVATKDFMLDVRDLNGIGLTGSLSLAALICLCSAALNKSVITSAAVIGNLSIGGTISKVDDLANTMQVCFDSGAKKVLIPITSASDMASVPAELMGKFNIIFYQTPEDAVFKALGVE